MQNTLANSLDALVEELTESAVSCNEIGARVHAYLTRQHFEVLVALIDAGNEQLKALLEATTPVDLFRRQADVVSYLIGTLTDQTQEILDIQRQARMELGLCWEDVLEASRPQRELAA